MRSSPFFSRFSSSSSHALLCFFLSYFPPRKLRSLTRDTRVPIIDSRSLIGQVALHRTAPHCTAHARTCGFLNLVIRL